MTIIRYYIMTPNHEYHFRDLINLIWWVLSNVRTLFTYRVLMNF